VGADGLRSAIRTQVVGDGAPIVSGHTTFRSVIPTGRMPEELRWNAATLWAGPKCHIVHYPLKGWQVFNLVATYDSGATEAVIGKPVDTDLVRATFGHVCERARRIIAHGENWRQWVLCDREPVRNWVDGRALLLGDAAHPMLQYFAQGACMALEDAVCLAHEVERHATDLDAAFAAYNRSRAPRTGRVQMGSRLLGQLVYHPEGAKADVRNAVLGAMSPEDHYLRLQWLYGGTGLDTA
jgi:salicylate hydroxylase